MSEPIKILRTRWNGERIARMGFLVGLGWDAKRIASDALIASTPNNVHRQVNRFGLAFSNVQTSGLRVPGKISAVLDAEATKRGMTQETWIRLLLITLASDKYLIDNILDDGELAQ